MTQVNFHKTVCIAIALFTVVCSFSQERKPKYINSPLQQPAYLQKGDTVMIVATAGIFKDSAKVDSSVKLLEDWGLHVKLGKHLYSQVGHFAGTDAQRTEDFQTALDDHSIKAIWSVRGGYGTVRIIDKLDFTNFLKNPKWIIGFSDVTALHSEIHVLGRESMHAMMPATYNPDDKERKNALKSFKRALFGKELDYKTEKSDFNIEGEATGQLVGGNLSILYSLLGSKSSISTNGKILFIEDVGEALYHIDRMIQNLKRNGLFSELKGLIIGGMTDMNDNTIPFGKTAEEIIWDAVKEYEYPVCFNFPAGHIPDNRALLIGSTTKLSVSAKKVTLLF